MLNKNLQQVIDNIYQSQKELEQKIASETDPYKKHDLEFERDTVTNERLARIYLDTIDNISEDMLEKIQPAITKVIGSNDDYDRFVKNVLTNRPKSTLRDIFKGVPTVRVTSKFDEVMQNLSEFLSDDEMNKVAKSAKNYIAGAINNTPIHPLSNTIEGIKKGEKFNALSNKDKVIVSKELDEINEVVKESPRRYSEAQTNFDTDYERITNKNNDVFFKNYITQDKDFGKAFSYYDQTFMVKEDVAGDQEKVNIATSPSFALSKETQDSILKVWKKMDELDIISAGNGAETGSKIYGFAKLHQARKNIDNALSAEQFDNLKALKDEYEKQAKNVREMYSLIKKELNPSPERLPGNVQNYREDFVPAEFKNDICTNATFNGMYNAYSIVKSMGISPEEFLRNPQPLIEQNFNNELTKFHIDRYYQGMTFDETLARVYSEKSKAGINSHGMPRMVGTLNFFEKNDAQRKNNLIYAAVQSGKIQQIFDDEQICYNYFAKERTKTFINLLFANPEDKDFYKMKSYDCVTGDRLHKLKAFDFASYLQEKNIPADVLNDRINNFLATAYKLSFDSEKAYAVQKKKYDKDLIEYKKGKLKVAPEMPESKALSKENFVSMVKDIQQGVIAYMMLTNPERSNGIDKLTQILSNPADALKNLNMDDSYIQKLNGLKGKNAILEEYKQRAIAENGLNIEDVRLKETLFNKSADKLLKKANKISKKIASTNDAKKIERLQMQSVEKLNELKALQKAETERLDREYKAGNIPSEYYQKRVENIVSLNHNNKIAIFDDGLNKKEFIKSTGLEQLSRSEANKLFDVEIAKQKVAKDIFINKQFLQNNNLISTNKEIEVQKANFEQIDVSQIESTISQPNREPLVVNEAKIQTTSEKTEPQKEIDPKQTVKMP